MALRRGSKTLAGIDKLYFAGAFCRLVPGDNPDIGGNARIVKAVVGELDDGFKPVVFNKVTANLGLAGTGIAGKEGRTVLDDGHTAFRTRCKTVEQKEHLPVTLAGQAGAETA